MMSINEIKNYSFKLQRGNTYKASEVDEFFSEVKTTIDALTSAYEKAKKDNEELYRKMNVLADRIEEYRKDEDSIRATLITAQRMAESVVAEANNQAKALVDEAQKKADETILGIKGETDDYVIEKKNEADLYAAKLHKEADEYIAAKTAEADELFSKAKTEYDERMSDANVKAEKIVEKAKSEAARVISDCEEKKAEIIAKANTQADEIVTNTQARIENSKKKLDELKAMTAQFKAGVVEVLQKEIQLFDEITVNDSDYSAEYYPTAFSIDADTVYRPELTVDEENTQSDESDEIEEIADTSDDEAKDAITEEDIQIDDEPEQQEEATQVVAPEEAEEAAKDGDTDKETEEDVEIADEDIEIEGETEPTKEEPKSADSDDDSDTDYYELLMKELAEEKDAKLKHLDELNDNDGETDIIENPKTEPKQQMPAKQGSRNVFTKLDLSEGLDDSDDDTPNDRVDLSDMDGKQLRFGKDYDIFDEEEETQGSFFSKFKKK